MADDPRQFTPAELANVYAQATRGSNREYQSYQRQLAGVDDFELPPAQQMLGRSPIVNYAKQILPENLGATKAGDWVAEQVNRLAEAQPQMRPQLNRANALAAKMPLGGWSKEQKDDFGRARVEDPLVRRTTVEAGMAPTPDNTGEVRMNGDIGARAAQVAGVVQSDVMQDGLRNIWWFINAPQALTNLVADETVQREGYKILNRENEPIIKNRGWRMAATLPAVLATSFGVGNVMREEGYKAVLPGEGDPRVSENPIAETGARYFLGRTGGLLPYEEFVKERPDFSMEEYYKYKTYLFDKESDINPLDGDFNVGGVVKGTLDGIHGPEVAFLGKSIPALTGMVPIATAIAGTRRGLRRAGDKLRNASGGDMIEMADKARQARNDARREDFKYQKALEEYDPQSGDTAPVQKVDKETLERAENDYQNKQAAVERVVLENALFGGGTGALAGGVGATAIESVIRSLKPSVSYQDEDA